VRPNLRHAFQFSATTRRTFTSARLFVCAPGRTLAAVPSGTLIIASETRRATNQRRMRWIHRHCLARRDHSNEGHPSQEQRSAGTAPNRRLRLRERSAPGRAVKATAAFGCRSVVALGIALSAIARLGAQQVPWLGTRELSSTTPSRTAPRPRVRSLQTARRARGQRGRTTRALGLLQS
jgi:hypothetical protein